MISRFLAPFTDEELRGELNRRNTTEYDKVQPAEVGIALATFNAGPIHDHIIAGKQMRHGLGREGAKSQFSFSLRSSIGDVHMVGLNDMTGSEAVVAIASRCNSILESRSRSKHI